MSHLGTANRAWLAMLLLLASGLVGVSAFAQAPADTQQPAVPVDAEMVESLMKEAPPTPQPVAEKPSGLDLLSLITLGGPFMIPIGVMSLLVVTLAVERLLSLRQKRVIPRYLVEDLNQMSDPIERFNPSIALQSCQEYPSAAATVLEAMLKRTGQPLAEIEHAAAETVQREADDYAAPIRWLILAASATPLMGLLGTVWGMIVAFHESTTLTADRSRSEQLSEGIYTALITTLAGLVVAIPAAILAQYLENRLSRLFHKIERLAFDVAPGIARFNGRMRLEADGVLRPIRTTSTGSGTPGAAASGPASGVTTSGPVPPITASAPSPGSGATARKR